MVNDTFTAEKQQRCDMRSVSSFFIFFHFLGMKIGGPWTRSKEVDHGPGGQVLSSSQGTGPYMVCKGKDGNVINAR